VESVEVDAVDGRVTVFPRDRGDIFHVVVKLLEEQRVRVDDLQLERGRLEEVFGRITGDAEGFARAA
jgi:ABC-2 type transport system ATP-binding protein